MVAMVSSSPFSALCEFQHDYAFLPELLGNDYLPASIDRQGTLGGIRRGSLFVRDETGATQVCDVLGRLDVSDATSKEFHSLIRVFFCSSVKRIQALEVRVGELNVQRASRNIKPYRNRIVSLGQALVY